jgi:Tat protein secretion system quality control protein TatD with DNase activity
MQLGYHPWFTHTISLQSVLSKDEHYKQIFLKSRPADSDYTDAFEKLLPLLPDPIPLHDVLSDLRHNFEKFPEAMLGEVGLDRAFRVAFDYFASPRQLTPFTIPFDHQLAVLEAQLDIAVELGRNVSLHSVKAQKATLDLLERMARRHGDEWNKISIDMHSCGFSVQMWTDVEVLGLLQGCAAGLTALVRKNTLMYSSPCRQLSTVVLPTIKPLLLRALLTEFSSNQTSMTLISALKGHGTCCR